MPTSGATGAGPASIEKGSFRLEASISRAFDLDGGHTENRGVLPDGTVIDVPEHAHEVSINLARIHVQASYALRDNWDVGLRLPFDRKDQDTSIQYPNPVTDDERAAIERNGFIHHRDATYDGLSDPTVFVAHRRSSWVQPDDQTALRFGLSLPFGQTEDDPLQAGNNGEKHLHIQFGTGTVNPVVELDYVTRLARTWFAGATVAAEFPLYENSKGFRGSRDVTIGFSVGHMLSQRFSVQAAWATAVQGYAEWNGVQDYNSGLVSHGLSGVASWRVLPSTSAMIMVRAPVSQRNLNGSGEAFQQGLTVGFTLNREWSL